MSKEAYFSVKRNLSIFLGVACDAARVSKETYYCVKRDLLLCQKRPTWELHAMQPDNHRGAERGERGEQKKNACGLDFLTLCQYVCVE